MRHFKQKTFRGACEAPYDRQINTDGKVHAKNRKKNAAKVKASGDFLGFELVHHSEAKFETIKGKRVCSMQSETIIRSNKYGRSFD